MWHLWLNCVDNVGKNENCNKDDGDFFPTLYAGADDFYFCLILDTSLTLPIGLFISCCPMVPDLLISMMKHY